MTRKLFVFFTIIAFSFILHDSSHSATAIATSTATATATSTSTATATATATSTATESQNLTLHHGVACDYDHHVKTVDCMDAGVSFSSRIDYDRSQSLGFSETQNYIKDCSFKYNNPDNTTMIASPIVDSFIIKEDQDAKLIFFCRLGLQLVLGIFMAFLGYMSDYDSESEEIIVSFEQQQLQVVSTHRKHSHDGFDEMMDMNENPMVEPGFESEETLTSQGSSSDMDIYPYQSGDSYDLPIEGEVEPEPFLPVRRRWRLSDIEANVHKMVSHLEASYVPTFQQKQAAAIWPGRRDIKVKALEAAKAAKRREQEIEKERRMKKEFFKIEIERSKKKKADMAARKKQKEEDERKQMFKKRKPAETRKEQKALHEKSRGGRIDTITGNIKASENVRQFKKDDEKSLADVVQQITCPPEKETNILEKSPGHVGSVWLTGQDTSYDISPYQSGDYEDGFDLTNKKFVPSWASQRAVDMALPLQQELDPETIFSKHNFCSIDEVLLPWRPSPKEGKHNNTESNITSFASIVQQRQAAAVFPAKRDIKVNALEAAKAAKRREEEKENKRKMKTEAFKIELARIKKENARVMKLYEKKRLEEMKKKEVVVAASNKQSREDERKQMTKTRKIAEVQKEQKVQHEKSRDRKDVIAGIKKGSENVRQNKKWC